mmetsp:Transcript_54930/g.117886  ORF Transcript_54930/g.117886 Transcript_54930/m.117886 type:complete len:250 (+) Transcript_54930:61-810(+)
MWRCSLAVTAALLCRNAASQGYPDCVEKRTVLRHAGAHGIFVDMSAFGTHGCWQNDCKYTDKFSAGDQGVCARACSSTDECTHWTFGEQEGGMKCFFRKSDGGREEAEGWSAAPKVCAPPTLPEAHVALATAELHALKVCDAGKSEQCPDMTKAVTTWRFAISNLKKASEGALDANTAQYVAQIEQDTEAFAAQMSEENFPVIANNNRQVFEALRGWMDAQPKGDFHLTDHSLPNPLRGKLCGATSCYE